MNFNDALQQLRTTVKNSKFDQTVELHINLGIDISKPEQLVRTVLTLPHGTGKEKRVVLITSSIVGANSQRDPLSGHDSPAIADLSGGDDLIDKIIKGEIKPKNDFDAVVATPDMMPKLAKAARILGPVGMMPNPKSGTVTSDPEKTIAEIKKGQLDLRVEKGAPVIHTLIGKLSFKDDQLAENFKAVIDALNAVRPNKLKGKFIRQIALKSTQSPAVIVEI